MKKNLLALALLAGLSATAQTPRLSLYEEFTGETCPPCAATNPGLNLLLASPTNTPKIVAIKWQVPIPSAPSNTWSLYQTYKTDIDWRWRPLSYPGYGYTPAINSAPSSKIDGQEATVFGASSGHPANLNNTVISTAQSYTSAFSVTMNRAWNANFTAVTLTVNITASANFTAVGALVFRTVMVEKMINFATQPGTNGEKDFEDVAIASFPTLQTGVSMAPTWTVGQSQTFTLNCPLPSYTRDKAQVAFVGFIQDDGSQKVAQAVRANPNPLAIDAKAVSAIIPQLSCASSFTPSIEVKNNGTSAITDLTITPYVDGVAGSTFTWNGNIAAGATNTISLNSMTTALAGGHTFSYNISGVSGGDNNTSNNSKSGTFFLASSYQSTPVAEAFAVASFPPAKWAMFNDDGGPSFTRVANTNGISLTTGTGATKYAFYDNNKVGDKDILLMPPMDLSGANSPTLSFDVAYVQYQGEDDSLEVYVSKDCGVNWLNVFVKSGSSLSTGPAQTGAFTPASGSTTRWRTESIDLPGYNVANVLVKFVATSDYGNNMYIDNINLEQTNPTGISKINNINLHVDLYPNPANGVTSVKIESLNNDKVTIKVVNTLGQVVLQTQADIHTGSNSVSVDVKDLATGLYNVVIDSKNASTVKKLTVTK